jgi:hypothetical protein
VPGVKAQPYRCEEQRPGERRRSRDRDRETEHPGDDASQRRLSGVREPAILLATRVVHAATASSSQPVPNALPLAVGSAIALDRPTAAGQSSRSVRYRVSYGLMRARFRGIGP